MKRLLTMLLSAAPSRFGFRGLRRRGPEFFHPSAANGEAAGSSSTSEASTGETD